MTVIKPNDLHVDQVGDLRWVVAHHPDSPEVVVAPALPPYASPELAEAWRDRLTAVVNRSCHRCGVVAYTPPEMKTAPPGASFAGGSRVVHEDGCVCTGESLDALELACSPFDIMEEPDLSEDTLEFLGAYLTGFKRMRAAA